MVAWSYHWDPYPFILMNLLLSLQAAYTAPMIMMSQNRKADRDRLEAHNDYLINLKAEEEIRAILDHLVAQDQALMQIAEDEIRTILDHLGRAGSGIDAHRRRVDHVALIDKTACCRLIP